MKKTNSISIVIPSWNSESQLKSNFGSVIKAAEQVDAEIIIIDDASVDNSVAYLQKFGDKIKLEVNETNLGFGDTVNKGVRMAEGKIVILLNTDVKPDLKCFVNALKYFDNQKIFAVTFNSQEETAKGYWSRGLFHHSKHSVKEGNEQKYSLWAMGGQAAFDKNKWLKVGGMDKLYRPFYWEDTDLGYSAWKRGWEIIWGQDCHVVHDHSASVIRANFPKSYIHDIAQRNQFLFVWKNVTDHDLVRDHIMNLPRLAILYPVAFIQALFLLPQALLKRQMVKRVSVLGDQEILSKWQAKN